MKSLFVLSVAGLVALPAVAQDVGVSVMIGQLGFYGQIDIGRIPPPPLIFPKPIIIQHPRGHRAGASLPACSARTRAELGQALPQVRCMRAPGLFRAGRLV
ncbi:MAG: hypothetical protein EXR39_02195 [Betaproteobacteria bacterium]|nr:hypothetical protein [Betaproteobacteria bacterium]